MSVATSSVRLQFGRASTEVQSISFVGSTSEVCHPQPLCNLQNLCPVPPYGTSTGTVFEHVQLGQIAKALIN